MNNVTVAYRLLPGTIEPPRPVIPQHRSPRPQSNNLQRSTPKTADNSPVALSGVGLANATCSARIDLSAAFESSSQPPLSSCCDDRLNPPYTHPHPPITPLQQYFERYARRRVPEPVRSQWSECFEDLPHALKIVRSFWPQLSGDQRDDVLRAFYAQCTHIDHQLRLVIATLREEGLLDDTILMLASDHGDMLGGHGLYAKRVMLEDSARIPMVLVGTKDSPVVPESAVDDRLVGLNDVMPTLLELAGIPVPDTCDGRPMTGPDKRDMIYGEALEGDMAMRMVRDERYKLIWYPTGNAFQLFDLQADSDETQNLAGDSAHAKARDRLERALVDRLYGDDLAAVSSAKCVGF